MKPTRRPKRASPAACLYGAPQHDPVRWPYTDPWGGAYVTRSRVQADLLALRAMLDRLAIPRGTEVVRVPEPEPV